MSRKDFILLARVMRERKPGPGNKAALLHWNLTRCALTDALATTNPRFDRERFTRACGVQS